MSTKPERPTQGNIVTAILALQQGARVYLESNSGEQADLIISCAYGLRYKDDNTAYVVGPYDTSETAFNIEWPKPRTPKRGEVWGKVGGNLVLGATPRKVLVAWGMSPNMLELVSTTHLVETFEYLRDATPEEMAQFDGGEE